MHLLSTCNRLFNLLLYTVTEASPGSPESAERPWCELYYKLKQTNALDDPNSATVRSGTAMDLVTLYMKLLEV